MIFIMDPKVKYVIAIMFHILAEAINHARLGTSNYGTIIIAITAMYNAIK